MRGVLWRGVGSGSLCAGTYSWGFPRFGVHGGGHWEGQGVCIADDPESPWGIRGDPFGYVAGLLSIIGCLEGHNVKPAEVAAMREVCWVRGWEIPSEFSLNPPNSPAVLIHWRALIELLGLMPAPRREALCSLRFPVVSSRGSGSSGEPPAVKPEEPMDWSHEGMGSGGLVGRVPAEGQRGPSQVSATRAGGFPVPRPVPLFSLKPVPSPHLVGWS